MYIKLKLIPITRALKIPYHKPSPRCRRHSCLVLKSFDDVIFSLQPNCALILSTNGKMLHGCAWVIKESVYAWPCNWPYTHAYSARSMLCKRWVLRNQSQGLVIVKVVLCRIRLVLQNM